jgi:polysaccharide export outer membrane protein
MLLFRQMKVALIALVLGCTTPGQHALEEGPTNLLSAPFSADNYSVAPTDTLHIEVYREADLSGSYYVDPSGSINLPLLGRVQVAGLSLNGIEQRLARLLRDGYIMEPDVRVSIQKFRPIFVSGEVKSPGRYTFTPGMTVQQAVLLAGGETRFAAKKFYLQRTNGEAMRVDESSVLFPGDVITVNERLF